VPTIALVEQQFNQFRCYFDQSIKCIALSSKDEKSTVLDVIAADTDILIMTAQIMLDALESGRIASLADYFTLVIFDECHKAMKKYVYNAIMQRHYVAELLKPGFSGVRPNLPQVSRSALRCVYSDGTFLHFIVTG
jgi:ERCC4-related helicase